MHFHLPKPLHGWREFAGEVGIIVLGVLIALAAEQTVQAFRERQEVAQLRRALRAELADDRARWEQMRTAHHCDRQRLADLEEWLATAPASARLPRAYRLFLWTMHSSAWDIAKASPVAAKLPLDERLTYGSLYAAIVSWEGLLAQERSNADAVTSLFANADQPESRQQARVHLTDAETLLERRESVYPYFFTRFDQLRIQPDASGLTIRFDPNALCRPLGK